MSAPRRACRVDRNQAEITEALRAIGATVQPIHAVGDGCPDLLVGYRGLNILLEVKDGGKPPSKRRLTEDEEAWHQKWRGQVATVETIDQAIEVVCGVKVPPGDV